MKKWIGSAGVCIENGKLLMVLQGTPDEEKRWSVPSGGQEQGERSEECCIREVLEETGYLAKIIRPLFVKETELSEVSYFEIKIAGGSPVIQDPDGLIYDISWIGAEELERIPLSFPEDREFLLKLFGKQELLEEV
ncbi:NUDIX hydrolase [Bacillus infantis]|uniref:NUDIX domain-containing protein n=1 Tax=Bacillus infantis TaxID=324767 RepID=UPI001CD4F416|nr:NUDIX hydrolase [Bacillus infantis]MCA1038341.1 NUDIX hydrolase [Bacillus infantis]